MAQADHMASLDGPIAPVRSRATPGAWWMLAVLCLFQTMSFFSRQITSLLAPMIEADLHISDLKMGIVLGPAFAIPYALASLPFGLAADRFDRRKIAWLGMTLWSASTAACGLVSGVGSLSALRAICGAGEASVMPTAYSLLPDRFPRDRLTTAISIHQAGVKAGTALAFSVGAALLALFAKPVWAFGVEWHNWQLVFLTTSLPGLAVALLIFTFREPARRAVIGKDAAETGKEDLISFLKANQRFCWLMMAGFGSIAICAAACASWVPTFLTRSYHMKPIVFGPILAFISVITAFVLVAKGVIVDFLASRGMVDAPLRFYTWILGASLPLGLSFELPSAWLFLILYGAIIVVTIPYMVWVSSTIQLVVPARLRGQITGFFLFGLTLLGLGLGPMIVAFITDGILRDESKLGLSLAIVLTTGLGVAFFTLRAALSPASKLIASHGAA